MVNSSIYKDKRICIWGLGKVGMSAARFLQEQGATIIGIDKNTELNIDNSLFGTIVAESSKDIELQCADYIIASPGVDVRNSYHRYHQKWVTELDLFYHFWKKPIYAVTGSIGKTTVTHLLGQLLQRLGCNVAVGGNIGTPMLDFVQYKDKYDAILLEVSSFQLEHCTSFAPDLAIWTNFIPNHLDRHTIDEYFEAKTQILTHQKPAQLALIPYDVFTTRLPEKPYHILCPHELTQQEQKRLHEHGHTLYYLKNNMLYKNSGLLLDLTHIATNTFIQNWATIGAALDLLGYETKNLSFIIRDLTIP